MRYIFKCTKFADLTDKVTMNNKFIQETSIRIMLKIEYMPYPV